MKHLMLYSQKCFKSKDKYTSLTAAPTCSGWSTESDMLIASRRSFCNVCSLQLGSLIWLNAISTHSGISNQWADSSDQVSQIRGVREGLFLFPFPPIPIPTHSHVKNLFPFPFLPDTTVPDSHSHYRHQIVRYIESQEMYNKTHSKH